ncbi:hypothetical protein [Lysobacter claricitrinus]|uniref:hypothetical protein n=1 Tax=Lysobacter claricitrinus TaxID=3367728 RepID=UPI0037DBC7CE
MTSSKRPHEDGGYGNSNLVGSDESGLRSAIESRELMDDATHRAAPRRDAASNVGGPGRVVDRSAGGRRVDGADSSAAMGTSIDDATAESTGELSGGRSGRNGLED